MPDINERHSTMDYIDNARAQGCLSRVGNKPAQHSTITSADINNLSNWLTEAKNSQGYPHAVQGHVSAGSVMTNVLASMRDQAVAIQNYCTCHCQCSGGCKGSCTGTCTGSCTGSCAGSCTGNCTGGCKNACTNSQGNTCAGGDYSSSDRGR